MTNWYKKDSLASSTAPFSTFSSSSLSSFWPCHLIFFCFLIVFVLCILQLFNHFLLLLFFCQTCTKSCPVFEIFGNLEQLLLEHVVALVYKDCISLCFGQNTGLIGVKRDTFKLDKERNMLDFVPIFCRSTDFWHQNWAIWYHSYCTRSHALGGISLGRGSQGSSSLPLGSEELQGVPKVPPSS